MSNEMEEKDYTKKFLTTPSVIYACYSNVIGIPTELASEIFELLAGETPTCYVKTLTGVPADIYEFERYNTAIVIGDIVFGNVFATKEVCQKYHALYEKYKADALDDNETELGRILLMEGFVQKCITDGFVPEKETEAVS